MIRYFNSDQELIDVAEFAYQEVWQEINRQYKTKPNFLKASIRSEIEPQENIEDFHALNIAFQFENKDKLLWIRIDLPVEDYDDPHIDEFYEENKDIVMNYVENGCF